MTSPRYLGLALAAFGACAIAAERTTPAEPPPALLADAGEGDADEIDRAARSHGQTSRVLRCWQEGRLIVERPVRSVPPESLRAVQLGDGREAMRLYDLRNSTCLIE
ncbi:hypothetical protein [Tahibacter soli]|uniref:Peptidase inhibitor I78 family protein n=1 Tax=Tahibacter soli TaxID=2983605 RepID=A0A9X3YN67_9GAMM|nr:hypothetical protein [Tahibacter soli]MDC8015397.1 hypothetical protein [Tahibacter soli]